MRNTTQNQREMHQYQKEQKRDFDLLELKELGFEIVEKIDGAYTILEIYHPKFCNKKEGTFRIGKTEYSAIRWIVFCMNYAKHIFGI